MTQNFPAMLKGILLKNINKNGLFWGEKGSVRLFINERKDLYELDKAFKILKKWEEKSVETYRDDFN